MTEAWLIPACIPDWPRSLSLQLCAAFSVFVLTAPLRRQLHITCYCSSAAMFESLPSKCTRYRRNFSNPKRVLSLVYSYVTSAIVLSNDGKKEREMLISLWKSWFPLKRHHSFPTALPIIVFSSCEGSLGPPQCGAHPSLYVCDHTAVLLVLIPTYNKATAICMGMIKGLLDSLLQRKLLNPR